MAWLSARAALCACLLLSAVDAQHDTKKAVPNKKGRVVDDHDHVIHGGNHISSHAATLPCKPILCTAGAVGCQNVTVYNWHRGINETTFMACEGCKPKTCAHGEHDCKPIFCDIGGELHGGHETDPCEQGHHGSDGLAWWPFLLFCLVLTCGVTAALRGLSNGACCGKSIGLPFTVVMFLLGYFISSLVAEDANDVSKGLVDGVKSAQFLQSHLLFDSVLAWKQAHPHIILFVLLPPLLFEDAASMDYYVFRKVLVSSVLLAGPGVAITMVLCACTTMLLFGLADECVKEIDHVNGLEVEKCEPQLPVSVHLLLGGMLAATDPVAVCAVLNDLGCPDKLNFLIAGESLLNDGTAVVAFLVMQGVAGGCDTTVGKGAMQFAQLAGGGVVWGLFTAAVVYQCIKNVRDPNIEITTVLFAVFTTFWMAENVLGVSGVLGTVVFGVQTARTSMLAMDSHTHHAAHSFWSEVGYVATSIIFILAGVKSRDKIAGFMDNILETSKSAEDANEFSVSHQALFCFLLWIMLGLIRALVVLMFSPILTRIGYGLSWKEAAVMVWGGLRGAVSLSLALLVDGNHLIGDRAREMIFIQTVGIVTLTLLINGTTAGMVYKKLQPYPFNPFRPALATQGLRNLQLEMDKYIHNFSNHWFHNQSDVTMLLRLFPNFSEAYLFDGDLVDVQCDDIHSVFKTADEDAPSMSPLRLGIAAADLVHKQIVNVSNLFRVGYEAKNVQAGHDAMQPDVYCEVGAMKGDYYKPHETKIVRNNSSPVWKSGRTDEQPNRFPYFLPEGPDLPFLYVHVIDNILGETDVYLGEAKLNLLAVLKAGPQEEPKEFTINLTPCTQVLKIAEFPGEMPIAVAGTITVAVEVVDKEHIFVTVIKGTDIGGVVRADTEQEAGHAFDGHAEGGHGHGSRAGHAVVLKNVKRWIEEAAEVVDSSHAMYEILLTAMKTQFIHDRESKLLSVRGYVALNAAINVGFDLNQIDMDKESLRTTMLAAGTPSAKRLAELAKTDPTNFKNPIDAMVQYVIDFAEKGLPFGGTVIPSVWFGHRLTCAEMFLGILTALKDLTSSTDELGEEFSSSLLAATNRARTKLLGLQAEAPNTFRIAHSLIAFRATTSEFRHRVGTYQDQGFFADKLVDEVVYEMQSRERAMEQYCFLDTGQTILGLLSCNKCNADHPIVCAFNMDKVYYNKGELAKNTVLGLVSVDEENSGEPDEVDTSSVSSFVPEQATERPLSWAEQQVDAGTASPTTAAT